MLLRKFNEWSWVGKLGSNNQRIFQRKLHYIINKSKSWDFIFTGQMEERIKLDQIYQFKNSVKHQNNTNPIYVKTNHLVHKVLILPNENS